MKTILVPTDFSPAADNAMLYAANLASSLKAGIRLVHVYQIPVSMSDVPVLLVSVEEMKNAAEKGLEKSKELVLKNFPGADVQYEGRLGNISDEINSLCKDIQPLCIVVGKHGASGMERILFGSTTLSLIKHAHCPLIAVPDKENLAPISNIALAYDGSGLNGTEQKIREFVQSLHARLHVIHVQVSGKETPGIKKLLPELTPLHQTIRNEEFVSGIEKYIKAHHIDMLIVLPHKHNIIERLFYRTHTSEVLQKINIPIMAFPEH
jgi:nucleotide-binding universal stress UspA family protein